MSTSQRARRASTMAQESTEPAFRSDTKGMAILIPFTPPSELFPNAARRLYHMRRHSLEKPLREQSGWYASQLLGDADRPLFTGPVSVSVYVAWEKGRRKPDLSALGLACKSIEDGLSDAKIWGDDRQVVEYRYRQGKDPEGKGYTRFEITEVQG